MIIGLKSEKENWLLLA